MPSTLERVRLLEIEVESHQGLGYWVQRVHDESVQIVYLYDWDRLLDTGMKGCVSIADLSRSK